MVSEKVENGTTLRVSNLPEGVKEFGRELDKDGDGVLDSRELIAAIRSLDTKHKENKNLKSIVCGLVVVTALLIAAIFGASITAARLSKEITVDTESGLAFAKGSHETQVMKTDMALFYEQNFSPVQLTNEELRLVREFHFEDGNAHFLVFGFARDDVSGNVTLLVQGGTVTFDSTGLIAATGDAATLLEAADFDLTTQERRNLGTSCSLDYVLMAF